VIGFAGGYRSALIIGLQGIRARKTRTLLSMISLFLGVLAVVAVATGAEMAQRALMTNVELQEGVDGTRRTYLPADDATSDVIVATLSERHDAVAVFHGMNATIGEPGVTPLNPGGSSLENTGMGVAYGATYCDRNGCYDAGPPNAAPPGQAVELSLAALTGDVRQFRPYPIVAGRWLDFGTDPSLSPGIVINEEAAKFFNTYRIPAQMKLPGAKADVTPRIIGVVKDGGYAPAAYARADEIANWMPDNAGVLGTSAGVELLMTPDSQDTEQILQSRLVAAGSLLYPLQLDTIASRERAKTELFIMQVVFYGLASLVLLIGVAGILNVSLATVGERVEEFALRRAVGTPRLLLAGIVLSETLLTGLFTAAIAIGAAAGALRLLAPFAGGGGYIGGLGDLTFPWQAGVAGVIAGLVAGVLGGLIPAIRAARISIASVMRA
jgi:putative ABC transport system permease protein